jgi:hypothetical protein
MEPFDLRMDDTNDPTSRNVREEWGARRDYWRWAEAPAASSRNVVRKPAAACGS